MIEQNTANLDDPRAYDLLSPDVQSALQAWIRLVIAPAVNTHEASSSYGLKHEFEGVTGIYLSNGTFKGGMLAAGHPPVVDELNWRFRIKPRFRRREQEETGITNFCLPKPGIADCELAAFRVLARKAGALDSAITRWSAS